MATFAVNRSIQLSLGIPRRALLTSWAKRDYSSEHPVRYTAWRCWQDDKNQKFSPLERCEKKGTTLFRSGVSDGGRGVCSLKSVAGRSPVQRCGDGSRYEMSSFAVEHERDIVSNDIGDFMEFEDSTASEAYPMECEFIEESGQLFDKPQAASGNARSKWDRTNLNKVKEDAVKMAVESLARRSFTAVDLAKKLRGKKYPPDVIESVIVELKDRGLLNDGLYAESFSQSRWLSSSWGPKRIRRALLQKGVSEADIDKATKLVFKDGDMSGGPQDVLLGMSKTSMDRLFVQASKQWLRGQNASLACRRSRIVRWLQYRGFDWGVTNFILKKLESKYPPCEQP